MEITGIPNTVIAAGNGIAVILPNCLVTLHTQVCYVISIRLPFSTNSFPTALKTLHFVYSCAWLKPILYMCT